MHLVVVTWPQSLQHVASPSNIAPALTETLHRSRHACQSLGLESELWWRAVAVLRLRRVHSEKCGAQRMPHKQSS